MDYINLYYYSFYHVLNIAVNHELADDLNYCRFEKPTFTPINHSSIKQTSSPPAPPSPLPTDPPTSLRICEEDVCQLFRQQKTRKAPDPDSVSPSCLRVCADQLAPIFTQIFNRSLELCESQDRMTTGL